MIHVEVGPAPEEFLKASLRKRELAALKAWLSELAAGALLAPALSGRYRSVPGLMGKLEAAFAHKCAFCESEIAPGAAAIMFYRPLGSPGSRIDAKSYYYPWLAWDWSNFYLACRDCVEVREPGFKVVQKAVPDISHLEQETAVFYAGLEDPYLLNPRIDTPIAFLGFRENGEILAHDGAERGQYTIANLKLNRPALVQKRKEAAQAFKKLWLAARALWFAETAVGAPALVEAVSTLAAQCQGSTPFAGMKAYLLMEWMVGETRIAWDSASYFAAAIQREPWLQAYQAATTTLGIQKQSSFQTQASVERPLVPDAAQAVPSSAHTNVAYIYIKGDMYQIGSIRGDNIAVGHAAGDSLAGPGGYEGAPQATSGERQQGAPSGDPPSEPPIDPQLMSNGAQGIKRYTDISCPENVWIGTRRFSVVVRLTIDRAQDSAAQTVLSSLRKDLPVDVCIDVARQLEVLNEPRQQITIFPAADSAPVVFDLRPREVGHAEITLGFFQSGDPIGTATFSVEVTQKELPEYNRSRASYPITIESELTPPDIVLHIAWNKAASSLQFTVVQDGGASWNDSFRPVAINGDPATQAAALYGQITSLVDAIDPTAHLVLQRSAHIPFADVDRRIKRLGQNLWRELIPDELKALYGRERKNWRNRTLLVYSDEPHFPWELLWPYESGVWEDEGPWCQTMRMTRWLRKDERGNGNEKAAGRLPINAIAILAPTYSLLSRLPSAQEECRVLRDLIRERNLSDVSPEQVTWHSVMDLLEFGGYDLFHIASHGSFYPGAPNGDPAIWLEEDSALTPQHIAGMRIEGYLRQHRPAFFFNACEVGRQGWALTRMGGWANRLIGCGVGFFIGPLWAVVDTSALAFANSFYSSLFAGETLASATQQARTAARKEGDPTWLAYSVYGHPNARLVKN